MSVAVEEQIIREMELAAQNQGADKAARLKRVKDLLIQRVPSKLPDYFPLLLEFRATLDPGEKEMILSIVMDCISAVPDFGCVTASIGFVRQMLNDAFPSVVMAALSAARKLISISIHTLCSSEHPVERKRLMWDALKGVIENVIGFDLTAHKCDGIRVLTFKLIEQLSLIMSASRSPAPPGQSKGAPLSSFPFRKELSDMATKCKKQLLQQGRPAALLKLPAPVQIVVLGCLAALACRQADAAKDAIPVLLQAAISLKDSGGDVGKSSARRSCVDAFVIMLKSEESWLLALEDQLFRGLQEMKEANLAQEIIKRRRTAKSKAQRAQERAESAAEEQPPKNRVKIDNSVPQKEHVDPFEPLPEYRIAAKLAAERIPKLLVQSGMSAVTYFVDQLDRNVLVELIISRMVHLPSESPPDHLTPEGCLKLQLDRCSAMLGPSLVKQEPLAPARAASPPPTAPEPQPQPAAEALPPARPATPPKPQRAPRPKIRAIMPSREERMVVQQLAVHRILKAPRTLTPSLRTAIAAKLAPAANCPEGHEVLTRFKHLLSSDMRAALDLVLSWLFVLFTRQCARVPPSCPEPTKEALDASTKASTVYLSVLESVLGTLLENCTAEDRLPGKGREKGLPPVTVLLGEVPLLPEHLAKKRLEWMFSLTGTNWGKVALFTMRELIKSKHVLKPVMLQLAIKQLLVMRDGELKDQAIKMLANQVYPVLNTVEAASVDDAAVKLLVDWVDHKPPLPEDPEIHEQYRRDMMRGAENACKLLEALCTKRTALIDRLWSVYLEPDQDEFVKIVILESTGKVGKKGVSTDSRRALHLIENCPPEAAPLVLEMVKGMVEQLKGIPTHALIDSCMKAYAKSDDLVLLSLVIPGMPREQALQYAPVLSKLPLDEFKRAVKRLVTGVGGQRTAAVSAQDLLMLYNTANPSDYGVSMRLLGQAVTHCLDMKEVFDRDAATNVLGTLVEEQELPTLIVRTLINVWHAHTELQRYLVVTTATRLVQRGCHNIAVLWTGFKMFLAFAMDAASIGPTCELLLLLPPNKLKDLLSDERHIEINTRGRLQDYVGRLDRLIDGSILGVLQAKE